MTASSHPQHRGPVICTGLRLSATAITNDRKKFRYFPPHFTKR